MIAERHLRFLFFVLLLGDDVDQLSLDILDLSCHDLLLVAFAEHVILGQLDQLLRHRLLLERLQLGADVLVDFEDDGGDLRHFRYHVVGVDQQRAQVDFDRRISDFEQRNLVVPKRGEGM